MVVILHPDFPIRAPMVFVKRRQDINVAERIFSPFLEQWEWPSGWACPETILEEMMTDFIHYVTALNIFPPPKSIDEGRDGAGETSNELTSNDIVEEVPGLNVSENTEQNNGDHNNPNEVDTEEIEQVATVDSNQIPECQICYEYYKADDPIYQCTAGHSVCGTCRSKIICCPFCRCPINRRVVDFEDLLQKHERMRAEN